MSNFCYLQNGLKIDVNNLIVSDIIDNFKVKEHSEYMDYYRLFTNDGIFIGYILKKKKNVSNYISNLLNNVIILTSNSNNHSKLINNKLDDTNDKKLDDTNDKKSDDINDEELDDTNNEELYDINEELDDIYIMDDNMNERTENKYRQNNSKKHHKKSYDTATKLDNNYMHHGEEFIGDVYSSDSDDDIIYEMYNNICSYSDSDSD